ncbi:hypothetical protein BRAS3843_2000012 [Bradyrhizobium sp. STM 3843]|nr:hypothetical protein BRAS3843_2000012 [Bradyrhizobium sp. STM 3843]
MTSSIMSAGLSGCDDYLGIRVGSVYSAVASWRPTVAAWPGYPEQCGAPLTRLPYVRL